MNRRQAKKLYKKLHGHNPPKGKIPAVLLRNPNKIQKRSENNMINECVGMRAWRKSLREISSQINGLIEGIKGKGDPVIITTRRLSENRKKNQGTAWRRARRNR